MGSSNDFLSRLAECPSRRSDPDFALIIAFDFYDGPERGLAIFPSGEGVRFSSLGDSPSRLFRSFLLTTIEGRWWGSAKSVPEVGAMDPAKKVIVPGNQSAPLSEIEGNVCSAQSVNHYIGVGDPYLKWLKIAQVSEQDAAIALRERYEEPGGFQCAHRIVKNAR